MAGLTKDHPDPERFHLEIVAAVAEMYLDGGPASSILSSASTSPLAAAFERAGLGAPDFAFFQDFTRRAYGVNGRKDAKWAGPTIATTLE